MNVLREFTDVNTTVATLMAPTHVGVLLAIELTEMATHALVHNISLIFRAYFSTCLTDINECTENRDSCSQTCMNTDGSYTCGCNPGYELNSDERTCQGVRVNS